MVPAITARDEMIATAPAIARTGPSGRGNGASRVADWGPDGRRAATRRAIRTAAPTAARVAAGTARGAKAGTGAARTGPPREPVRVAVTPGRSAGPTGMPVRGTIAPAAGIGERGRIGTRPPRA